MRWEQSLHRHWDKLLLAGGLSYLAIVSIWLGQQQRLPWQKMPPPVSSNGETEAKLTESNRQFISYLQQSLQNLDKADSQANSSPATTPPSPGIASLPLPQSLAAKAPPLPPPSSLTQTPRMVTPPKVVERYYYPVYPTTPAAPSSVANLQPQGLPAPPAPPNLPATQARPVPPTTVANQAIAPLVAKKMTYALVGVLESGDRSSALFTWDNLTQRLQVGEAIGASGWVLTGVDNQKAILSRGGKTRYLEVGQSF